MTRPAPTFGLNPAALEWRDDGSAISSDYGDIYFQPGKGLEETEAVFLAACGIPERWQADAPFVIGELGFGSGLNLLAVMHAWQAAKVRPAHLSFLSVEAHPMTAEDAARMHRAYPALEPHARALRAAWPPAIKGVHALTLPDTGVSVHVYQMGVAEALAQMPGGVDAWFLDGFAPARNPDMWSADVCAKIARLSRAGTRIGTFSVAGQVRANLNAAGFAVEKVPGVGAKRERLVGAWRGSATAPAFPLFRERFTGMCRIESMRTVRAIPGIPSSCPCRPAPRH